MRLKAGGLHYYVVISYSEVLFLRAEVPELNLLEKPGFGTNCVSAVFN